MAFDPVSSIVDVGKLLIERFIPDQKAKAEATQKLLEMQQAGDLAVIAEQAGINKIEASNANIFVSGWRPFVGWICGGGLGIQFIVRPIFTWIAALIGHPTEFPSLDMGTMVTLLTGMLGMAGMRTYEKLNGAQGNH